MRVVVDTNVLFSALFFPSAEFTLLLEHLISKHEMLVPAYISDELRRKALEKRPEQEAAVNEYLRSLGVRWEENTIPDSNAVRMRDPNDQPILDAAIAADADIILTGDKDFLALEIHRPKVMTPREFIDEFVRT